MTGGDEQELKAALERVTQAAERHAEKSGLALHHDAALRRHALLGLAQNVVKHGIPYCPCVKLRVIRKRTAQTSVRAGLTGRR